MQLVSICVKRSYVQKQANFEFQIKVRIFYNELILIGPTAIDAPVLADASRRFLRKETGDDPLPSRI